MFIFFRQEVRVRRKPRRPRWSHTRAWEGVCPRCEQPFDQDDTPCPICDEATLVVHRTDVQYPPDLGSFFLKAFRFSRMVGQQELRCSTNDGYHHTTLLCPLCEGAVVGSDNLFGLYLVPRLILYVPFVLVLSLGAVRVSGGVAFIFWPYVSSFFGWIYRLLFNYSFFPWPLRYLFNKEVAISFYETNEAPELLAGSPDPRSRR